MRILTHTFPELGTVRIPLFDESEKIFSAIETLPSSGPKSLERIEHLGELRQVIHCSHHSRYEYLLFQLWLIHFFKKEVRAFGLSQQVELAPKLTVSSAEELLKVWAILCENGHLLGTYEAERFWLSQLCGLPNYRTNFLTLFDDQEVQKIAAKVITEEDLLNFYRILSWLFLRRAEKQTRSNELKDTLQKARAIWLALFKKAATGTSLARCQEMFSRVRRLAYLYLDLARLPVDLSFNSAIIKQDFMSRPQQYLGAADTEFQHLADALQQMLEENIYASPVATAYKLERMLTYKNHLTKRLAKSGNNLITDPNQIEDHFQQLKSTPFTGRMGDHSRWNHFVRIRFLPNEYFPPDDCKPFSDEKRFRYRADSDRWAIFLTPYRTATGSGHFLDIFENPSGGPLRIGKVVTAIIEHILDRYESWERIFDIGWLVDNHLTSLFEAVLKRFFAKDVAIRILPETSHHELRIELLPSKMSRQAWSRKASWAHRRRRSSASRSWESNCFRREVRNAPRGALLVSNCCVVLNDESNSPIAEFDGIFFRIHGRALSMTLIEAKAQQKGASIQAEKQLRRKLAKLQVTNPSVRRDKKYAAATIKL